ncbi:MAG: 50S ribosomal protein L25 [Bacteroidales bacterium]|jgi:large subunit ribosomal protein L25
MKEIIILGEPRITGKKADVNNIRKEEKVPCILYGQGVENVSFSVDKKVLKEITHTPNSYIINLEIDGKKYLAVFHQIQYHPVTDEALHVDFLAVSNKKPVVIEIPINIFGNSDGVKQGGKLMVSTRKLRVSGMLDKLPDNLPIDITNLKLGKQIIAGELSYEGIQIISPKSTIICSVRMTRAAIGAAATAES